MGFEYNQESGMKAGGTSAEGGAYIGKIKNAVYKRAQTNSAGLELSFDSTDGREFNYLTLWYKKGDGTEIKGGNSIINAMMGVIGITQISEKQENIMGETVYSAPELIGKDIGLLLQKVWYTKGNGDDGYKFDIRMPFNPKTRQSLKEQIEQSSPSAVDRMASTMQDKDDRKKPTHKGGFDGQKARAQQAQGGQSSPANSFDDFDDIPFGD